MKKLIIVSGFWSLISVCGFAANWWQMPTICKVSTSNCYLSMGAGYDPGMWDADAACYGMKFLCPNAMTVAAVEPVPTPKKNIAGAIKEDFDANALVPSENCFGARRTNGAMASVGRNSVKIYCAGALDNPDEILQKGEIMLGAQPTCQQLADNGFVAVLNSAGTCYGKQFNPNNYFIDCSGSSTDMPTSIISLNGAPDFSTTRSAATNPSQIFNAMRAAAEAQKAKYFK